MSYIKTGAAHTNQLIEDQYGNEQTRYGRYETGFIEGEYRDMLALIADETGFDGLGFDANAGSNDDSWHVVNLFEDGGHYVDTVAIGGALDEDHALTLANTQFDYLGADYGVLVGYADDMQFDHMTDDQAWSIDAISKLLNNSSQDKHYLPIITSKELYTEATRATFNDAQWDNLNLSSHGGKLTNLYTDMRRADTFRELTQEFDLQQALIDIEAEEAEFDSIMDTVNRLPMLKDRLFRAMSQASNETLSVTNVTQTKPFKRGGVVNVAFVFDLSDGQKLSIWFHNPDSTPSKLLAGDLMVSWKWLLNKRDVTAILSPLNGQTVKIPTLARQMMLLASKNSKNFKRAQERKAKRDADINKAKETIEEKKQTVEQLDKDIESLKNQIDEAMKANKGKADKDTTADDSNLPEPNIQVASNGVRYESQVDTDAGEAIKIYMYSKNNDHWLVYGKDDGQFTVYANNAQSRAYSSGGGGYGMPKVFNSKAELLNKHPKFEAVFNEIYMSDTNSDEPEVLRSKKLTKLPNDKREAIENLFSDIKMGKKSDELLASMLAIFNHADEPLSDKDKGLMVGAAARLFDLKELNRYYLDKDHGLSENGIKAYNNALATLNNIKMSDMVDYLFRQDIEYPPKNQKQEENPASAIQAAEQDISSFINQATKDGWQLDIASLSSNEKYLHKTIGNTDVMLEVTNEGYNAMTPDGDVLSYGESSSLSNYEATNSSIENDIALHEAEVPDLDASDTDKSNEQENNKEEGTSMSEASPYSESDIEYLQSIVDGSLDYESVDMDRMIEIGEKDENDPLYAQALDIVLEAVDKASSNL